jgi:tetratricopeptide (TPR) repeat protein
MTESAEDAVSATEVETAAPTVDLPGRLAHARLERGTILLDRYTVLDRLGAGGMGEVYAAYDAKLDRKVALKLLLHGGAGFEARFVREAQAMARLSHPGVVAVFDTGRIGERMFLAMEFVPGTTLRGWQKEKKRPWGEILRMYVDAGRGLAAAHGAGLVHRDFKPDNVLVADDGAVKVTDFGIARARGDASGAADVVPPTGAPPTLPATTLPTTTATGPSLDIPMTEEGVLLGTPGYMAPEQYGSDAVDERTDQFAFCVALFDALYGYKPFAGESAQELGTSTLRGALREPPRGTAVPARVHRALVRGLSAESTHRYPSMHVLLADLVRDPAQRLRRILAAAGALGIVAVSAVAAARVTAAHQSQLCAGAEAEASDVWNPTVQQRIEHALVASGAPYAADTWQRTRRQIDDYLAQWTDAYTQTCEATRIRRTQSEPVMTVRMACLEQRREEVRALAQVLSTADRQVTSKALEAAMALTSIDRCKDVVSLTGVEPEPGDPAARAEIAAIRTELAAVKASYEAGMNSAAAARAGPLVARARAVGYRPLLAEAILASARARHDAAVPTDVVLPEALEAEDAADRGRADGTRADVATELLWWVAEAGHLSEAEVWSKIADAALNRAGEDGGRRVEWLRGMATLRTDQGRYGDSADFARRALETAKAAGLGPLIVARIQRTLALSEAAVGHAQEAERVAGEADDTIARTMGAEHPLRIRYLLARAYAAAEADRNARRSLEIDQEAIALAERVAPEGHDLLILYNNVCSDLYELGDCAGARPYCMKAVAASLRISGPQSSDLNYAYSSTGDALSCLGDYDAAVENFASSVAICERTAAERDAVYVHSLLGIGRAQLLAGKAHDAVPPLEKALASMSSAEGKLHFEEKDAAGVRFVLARALWLGGKRTPRIAELARDAADIDDRGGEEEAAREVRTWLRSHRAQ